MHSKVYRVDKFVVPDRAREEFLARVEATHVILRAQAGFVEDAILEQASGPGKFNFVTIVRWENEESLEPARQAVAALHHRMKFNPREMMARLGIRADVANYRDVDLSQRRDSRRKSLRSF